MTFKFAHDDVLDATPNEVKNNADLYTICSAPPTTYAEASSTFKLADLAIDSTDFTGPANGDVSGRKVAMNAQTGITVDSTGIGVCYALSDGGNSKLLYVTEVADVFQDDTAAAGGASTITLAGDASGSDDVYNGYGVRILSGTGLGQSRMISDYVGSTKVATVSAAWTVQPDNTSVYEVFGKALTATNLANTAAWDIEILDPAPTT